MVAATSMTATVRSAGDGALARRADRPCLRAARRETWREMVHVPVFGMQRRRLDSTGCNPSHDDPRGVCMSPPTLNGGELDMFPVIRRHLSYSNVAATLALVFAVTGGAFAATGHIGAAGSGRRPPAPGLRRPARGYGVRRRRIRREEQGQEQGRRPGARWAERGDRRDGGHWFGGGHRTRRRTGLCRHQRHKRYQRRTRSKGTPRAAGESVKSHEFTGEKEGKCPEGGSEFKVGTETATYACNGEKGVIHPGGTPLPKPPRRARGRSGL